MHGTANDAHLGERHVLNDQSNKLRPGAMFGPGLGAVDMGTVVGDMEAHGVSISSLLACWRSEQWPDICRPTRYNVPLS